MKYAGQNIRVVTAEITRDGLFLILRRPMHKTLPGLWEFPGGRVREGESDEDALRRKLPTLLGVGCDVGERLMMVDHPYEDYTVHLRYYRVDIGGAQPRPAQGREYAWVAPEEFEHYQFPAADEHTVALLLNEGDDE